MLIQSTKNYASERLKMLVYGAPGVGKTFLAHTIGEPTIVISAEGGLLSLKGQDIDIVDITTDDNNNYIPPIKRPERLQQVYAWLQEPKQREKYKWAYVDSLSEIGQLVVEKQNHLFPERKDSLPMWGEVAKEMRQIVKSWRDIPGYNVVFTALSETAIDDVGRRYQNVALPGKFSQHIPAYFDEVFYFHTYQAEDKGLQRVLITQSTDKAVAKDRSGSLDLMMEPNLGEISRRIRSGSSKQAPPSKGVEPAQLGLEAVFN